MCDVATSGWLNAYNAANAVSDSYALSSQAENLAQETFIAMCDNVVTPNGIPAVNSGWWQIAPIYQYIQNLLGDKIKRIESKVCTRNFGIPLWEYAVPLPFSKSEFLADTNLDALSTIVCMGPAARDSGNCPGVPARDVEGRSAVDNGTMVGNPEALVKCVIH